MNYIQVFTLHMDFIFVETRIMWCPNPTNVNNLGSGFGLQIYLLVGFLTVLQIQLQTQFKQSSYKYPCDFQPQNPLFLRLSPLPSLVYFPQLFCPPSFVSTLLLSSYFLLISSFFQQFTHQPPLICSHSPYIISSQWGSNHYYFAKFHATPLSLTVLRNYHVF